MTQAKENISIVPTEAQYAALRKMSLKYENMSVSQMAAKLFNQVVKNYYTTESKQIAKKAGEQWDAATKLGFDTKLSREEYVKRAIGESHEILNELR